MATADAPSKDVAAAAADLKQAVAGGAAEVDKALGAAAAAAAGNGTPSKAGAGAAAASAPAAAAPAAAAKKGGKAAPAFKNPAALSEPTKEMLVPGIMVVGASVLSWVAGRYNYSVLVSLGLGSCVYFAIKTLRDRITKAATIWADRNAQRKRVIGDEESAEWINTVLYRFWQFYEPVLCQNIRDAVQPQLDANCPGALSGLELGRFTLGKNPPFISSAKLLLRDNHHNEISEDRIVLNLGIGLHAPDLEVVVAAKTPVTSLPLAVKNVWFEGKLRIEIELVPEFPHAKTVLVTFLEKPIVDFSVVPLKSVNLFDLPGLSQLISGLIINGINDNLVNPEKLVIDLIPAECGHVEAAKGVMFVTVDKATYKETSALDVMSVGSTEVYAEIKIGKESVKTSAVAAGKGDTYAFNGESVAALVKGNLAAEKVSIYLRQKRMSGEKLLGKVYVPVADIVNSPNSTVSETIAFEAVPGSITATFVFTALAKVNVEEAAEGEGEGAKVSETAEQVADVGEDNATSVVVTAPAMAKTGKSGALLVRLHQAQDLPPKDSNGFADPYAILYYTDKQVAKTQVFQKNLAPKFDYNKEFTVADVDRVKFTLRLFDKDDIGTDEPMGDLDLDLSELFPVVDAATGEREFIVERKWLPLRKPGPLEEGTKTAADLKKAASGKNVGNINSGFGHVLISLIFRPAEPPAAAAAFHADLGNPEDDLSLTPYGGASVLGALGTGVGALGSGAMAGVGLVGSGVTGAAGLVGSGLKGAVNLTGKAGGNMTKHMSNFTSPTKKSFFSRKASGSRGSE